jgi:hypothetical protein
MQVCELLAFAVRGTDALIDRQDQVTGLRNHGVMEILESVGCVGVVVAWRYAAAKRSYRSLN